MAKIITYKNEGEKGTFCQIKLDSGERVFISIYKPMQVKISKMWLGILPGKTIWGPKSIYETLKLFFDKNKASKNVLDMVIEKILDCKSTEEIKKI
jgi:hypothetical protein